MTKNNNETFNSTVIDTVCSLVNAHLLPLYNQLVVHFPTTAPSHRIYSQISHPKNRKEDRSNFSNREHSRKQSRKIHANRLRVLNGLEAALQRTQSSSAVGTSQTIMKHPRSSFKMLVPYRKLETQEGTVKCVLISCQRTLLLERLHPVVQDVKCFLHSSGSRESLVFHQQPWP